MPPNSYSKLKKIKKSVSTFNIQYLPTALSINKDSYLSNRKQLITNINSLPLYH